MGEWFESLFGYRYMDKEEEVIYRETYVRLTFLAYVAGMLGGIMYILLPSLLNSMAILIICSSALVIAITRVRKKDTLPQSVTVKYDTISMFLTILILTNLAINLATMFKS